MAKWIEYDYVCNAEKGINLHKKVEYNAANLAIAQAEARNGYTITEDNENVEVEPIAVRFGGTGVKSLEELMIAMQAVRIQHGSYAGTGAAGEGSPSRLTFNFMPKLVVIGEPDNEPMVMICNEESLSCDWHTTAATYRCYCSRTGNSVKWWNTNKIPVLGSHESATAIGQKNAIGTTYRYVAIG